MVAHRESACMYSNKTMYAIAQKDDGNVASCNVDGCSELEWISCSNDPWTNFQSKFYMLFD